VSVRPKSRRLTSYNRPPCELWKRESVADAASLARASPASAESIRCVPRSFRLDLRNPDHFCPFFGFVREQAAEVGG
jgi:hypothetical protein